MEQRILRSNEFLDSLDRDLVESCSFKYLKERYDHQRDGTSEELEFFVPTITDYKKMNDNLASIVKYIKVTTQKDYINARNYKTCESYDSDVVVPIEGYLDLARDLYHFNHFENDKAAIGRISESDEKIVRSFVRSRDREWFKNRLQMDVLRHLDRYLKDNDLKLEGQMNMIRDDVALIVRSEHSLDLQIRRVNGKFTADNVKSDFARIPAYQVSLYIDN